MAGVADHAAGHDLPVAAGGWRLAAGGWRLAAHVATAATTTTGSVRFHRFFQHVALDGSKTARVVADLLGMRGKPWVVTGAKVWVTAHFFLASTRAMDSLRHVPPPVTLSALNRAELEALLAELFGEIASLKQTVAELREEIARLKGLKGRPNIKPSGMETGTAPQKPQQQEKRPGRGKVAPRVEVEEEVIRVEIPPGSGFKGHEPFLVQDLVISAKATCYLRERWITPAGRTILAPLPQGIEGHFGAELRRFVLVQYHQGQSTMPRLLALLRSVGIAISKRQLIRLLNENHERLIAEARDVLRAGLQTSPWVSVDDTGARHAGKNGFCTQIGNEWFT